MYDNIWIFFFFSSRRRHTRWPRDWSSDVCSSDLQHAARRAQRERPLVIVQRHLLVLLLLNDLEEPEANRQRGKRHDDADLQRDEPDGDSPTIFCDGH